MPRQPPGPAGRAGGKRARWTGTFCSRRSVQIRNGRPRSRGRTRPCSSTAPVPAHLPCWHGPQTVPAQPPVPAQAIVPAQTLRSRTGTIRGPSRTAACASTAWNHAGTGRASTERILCRDSERARITQPPFEHTRAGTGSGSCMNSFCVSTGQIEPCEHGACLYVAHPELLSWSWHSERASTHNPRSSASRAGTGNARTDTAYVLARARAVRAWGVQAQSAPRTGTLSVPAHSTSVPAHPVLARAPAVLAQPLC